MDKDKQKLQLRGLKHICKDTDNDLSIAKKEQKDRDNEARRKGYEDEEDQRAKQAPDGGAKIKWIKMLLQPSCMSHA